MQLSYLHLLITPMGAMGNRELSSNVQKILCFIRRFVVSPRTKVYVPAATLCCSPPSRISALTGVVRTYVTVGPFHFQHEHTFPCGVFTTTSNRCSRRFGMGENSTVSYPGFPCRGVQPVGDRAVGVMIKRVHICAPERAVRLSAVPMLPDGRCAHFDREQP